MDTHDTGPVTIGVLERARASFARRSWCDAYEQFATADAATPLDLDDLERLALAAYLSGADDESTLVWTRAHHEAIRRNDPQRAARNAFLIGSGSMFRGETAPAMGWFARGGRVIEGCDCAEHAWLLTWKAFAQMWGADPERAQPVFAEGLVVGERFDDSDLRRCRVSARAYVWSCRAKAAPVWLCWMRSWLGSPLARCRRCTPEWPTAQ